MRAGAGVGLGAPVGVVVVRGRGVVGHVTTDRLLDQLQRRQLVQVHGLGSVKNGRQNEMGHQKTSRSDFAEIVYGQGENLNY